MLFVRKISDAYPDIDKDQVYEVERVMTHYIILKGSKRHYQKKEFEIVRKERSS